jgi:MoxR-like ATPase
MNTRESFLKIQTRMAESIIGQETVIERLLIAILCNGNVLMEGLPGLAKTRAIKTLSKCIASDFSRIQFTPDLLPSDVTGTEVYYAEGGKGEFHFQPGPIFGNLILADEINRAPAKVQAALLEAMEERQVTVAGKTHTLPDLFMVLATQNPIEQEGTYPLPEAQMDRFLLHVFVQHPSDENEHLILRLVRGEEGEKSNQLSLGSNQSSSNQDPAISIDGPVSQEVVFEARREVLAVTVADTIEQYMVALISATRHPQRYGDDLKRWIQVGVSPRGTLALDRTARAHAWLQGRDHVLPDDVRAVVHSCLRHRLLLSYEANAEGVTADGVIDEIAQQVAVA